MKICSSCLCWPHCLSWYVSVWQCEKCKIQYLKNKTKTKQKKTPYFPASKVSLKSLLFDHLLHCNNWKLFKSFWSFILLSVRVFVLSLVSSVHDVGGNLIAISNLSHILLPMFLHLFYKFSFRSSDTRAFTTTYCNKTIIYRYCNVLYEIKIW